MKHKILIWFFVLVLLATAVNGALTDNLVEYWSFDNTSTDSLGTYNLSATAGSPSVTQTGKISYSTYTDNSNYWSAVKYDWNGQDEFTISGWIKYGDNDDYCSIYTSRDDGTAVNVRFRVQNDNQLSCTVFTDDGNYVSLDTTDKPAVNKWHYVSCVYDGTNISIYINGSLSASGTGTGSGNIKNIANPTQRIGWNLAATPYTMDGNIDELGVWNRALSSTEISELWNSGNGLAYPFTTPAATYSISAKDKYTFSPRKFTSVLEISNLKYKFVHDNDQTLIFNTTYDNVGVDTWGGNHGTLTGFANVTASIVAGPQTNTTALSFDGVDDYVESNIIYPISSFSVSAWFKANNIGTTETILTHGRDVSNRWGIIYSGNQIRVNSRVNSGSSTFLSSTSVNPGVWYFVSLIYDGSNYKLYLNDVLQTGTTSTSSISTQPLFVIGARNSLDLNFFNGSLSDVRIYNRALTPTEITELYTNPLSATIHNGLVAYYPLQAPITTPLATAGGMVDGIDTYATSYYFDSLETNVNITGGYDILMSPYEINITLDSPANGTWLNYTTIPFIINLSSNINLDYCELQINGTVVENFTISNNEATYNPTPLYVSGLPPPGPGTAGWENEDNLYDEDWNTYGYIRRVDGGVGAIGSGYLYINYTRPVLAKSANWTVKDGIGTQSFTLNDTFCDFTSSVLQLQVYVFSGLSGNEYYRYSCYNGSAFATIYQSANGYYNERFYEQSLTWDQGSIGQAETEYNLLSGTYLWSADCYGTSDYDNFAASTGSVIVSNEIVVDLVIPELNITGLYDNMIIVNTLSGLITGRDNNLYSMNISDDVTGTIYYNNSLTGLTEHNYTLNLDVSSYPKGQHNLTIKVADGHTATRIDDYKIKSQTFDNGLVFEFKDKPGKIIINPQGLTGKITAQKKMDRYSFTYDKGLFETLDVKTFYVESDYHIDILEGTGYKGHLVIPALDKWIDFEEYDGADVVIKRISDKKVEVIVTSHKPGKEKLEFNSIGDLNVIVQVIPFYVADVNIEYETSVAENEPQIVTVTLNTTDINGLFDSVSNIFKYNGTVETHTSKVIYATETIWTYNFNTPLVVSGYSDLMNLSHNMTFVQGTNQTENNITHNQTIHKLVIAPCGTPGFNNVSITFYGFGEENYNHSPNFNMNIEFELYASGSITKTSYSFERTGANNYSFCLATNDTTFLADATIEFYGHNATYDANRKYYLYAYPLSASNSSVNLYMLPNLEATDVKMSVYDEYGQAKSNIYIKVLRYYPELGASYVVEICRTNNEGKCGTRQMLFDPFYSYILQEGSEVVLTTSAGRLISDTKVFTLGSTERRLESFKGLFGIQYNLYFDNSTNTFKYVWNDATGLVQTMCLEVVHRNFLKDTTICSATTNCVTSNAGNLECAIGVPEDGDYLATVYMESTTEYSDYLFAWMSWSIKMNTAKWGQEGLMGALLLITALAMAMSMSAPLVVIATVLGVLAAALLGLLSIGWGLAITLITVGFIIVMRMKE